MPRVRFAWIVAALLATAAPVAAQSSSATLSGITCPGSGCLVADIPQIGQIAVQVTGSFSGTLVFERTVEGAWLPWALLPNDGRSTVSFTTLPGLFATSTDGSAQYRIRFANYLSGSALVAYNFVPAGTANVSASYVLGQASDDLINAQVLGDLPSGLMKNTNSGGATPTGTLSTATPGTDYLTPTGDGTALSGVALIGGSYTNPAWIASIDWSKLTGTPTTRSGYGITDAQPLDADLTAIAALATAPFGRGLLELADASSTRTALAVVPGTDVQSYDADLALIAALTTTSFGRSLLTLADAAAGRTALAVVPGTNVQAYSSVLDTFTTNGSAYYLSRANHTGTQAWSTLTGTPTTLAGYGITDAASLSAPNVFTSSMTFTNGSNSVSLTPFLAEGIMEMVGGWFKRESTATVQSYFTGWFKQSADRLYGLYAPNASNAGLAIANMDGIATTQTLTLVPFQHIERSVTGGNCNGAKTLDVGVNNFGPATGNWYNYTVTGSSCALTFSNLQSGGHYFVVLTVDGTGGYTQPSIVNTVKWDGGSAPALSMTAGKVNVLEFWFDGTNLLGTAQVIGG